MNWFALLFAWLYEGRFTNRNFLHLILERPNARIQTGLSLVATLSVLFLASCVGLDAKMSQAAENENAPTLILATTTSTQDSGLLDAILPAFEREHGVTVSVVAVGTGQALKLGEDGNADVLLVHACAREEEFVEAGHGVRRHQVMFNDFVILGPPDDPAAIEGSHDASEALQAIATAQTTFVSRGDDSGTHIKEKFLWKAAGVEPSGSWYRSTGQGMGAVLTMSNELLAYTLSDRSTYLKRTVQGIELTIAVEGDERLFNPYSVLTVNPEKGDHIQAGLANTFIDWLLSESIQMQIGDYGVDEFGMPLFVPTAAEPVLTECD